MPTDAFVRAAARAPNKGGRSYFRNPLWIRRDYEGNIILGVWASPLVRVSPEGKVSVQTDGHRAGAVSRRLALALRHVTGRPVKVDGRSRPLRAVFLDSQGGDLPIPARWE